MSRRHLAFDCDGSRLLATLDDGRAQVGLLLVSGGNEIRSGAWAGQADMAVRIAGKGFPVLRFDRRGVGDSEGENRGFRGSAPDITAALAAFRAACPAVTRIVGLGNCDAAAALMLTRGCGLDGLVLSNPWTIEHDDAPPPPEAVRDHYRRRLADPAAIVRLLTGKVSLARLARGLRHALRPSPPPTTLAQELAAGIAGISAPIVFLLAERDRTAQAFLGAWNREDPRIRICPDATHSYVEAHAQDWLADQVMQMLKSFP